MSGPGRLGRRRPSPPPLRPPRAARARLAVLALLALLPAACTRSAGSEGAARGLVALDAPLFVPPGLRDHDHPPGGGEDVAGAAEPHARPRPGYHDFGAVPFGATVSHTFRLENTDPVPVTIRAIDPSCGCTVPRIAYRDPESGESVRGVPSRTGDVLTVPPGAVAELEVRIDTRGIRVKNTDKLISVRVTSDSVHAPFLTLECHLVVDLPFQPVPERLDLGALPVGQGGSGRLQIVQAGDSGAVLTGVEAAPPGVLAELIADPDAPRPGWFLDVGLEPPLALGELVHAVQLGTRRSNGEPGPPFEVQVVARGVEEVEVRPGRLHLRGAPLSGAVDLVSTAGEGLRLTRAEVRGAWKEHLELVTEALAPDPAGASPGWRIALSAGEGIEAGSITGTVLVALQGDGREELVKEIPYVGFVR